MVNPPDNSIEVKNIPVRTWDTDIEIVNVYIPPVDRKGFSYHFNISHILQVIAALYLTITILT